VTNSTKTTLYKLGGKVLREDEPKPEYPNVINSFAKRLNMTYPS